MRLRVFRTVCLFVSIAQAIAAAQQTPPASPQPQAPKTEGQQLVDELKWLRAERVTVTTASLHDEELARAFATVRVVTRRQIDERGYRSLDDLLRDLPGVDVMDHSQPESRSRTSIRGITGNNKFLVLQDGVRINSPTGEPIVPIMGNFPLYAAKQVEVLYGPASAIYGADAFTGVINIITDTAGEQDGWRLSGDAGSFDTGRADFYVSRAFTPTVGLTFGGHWQQSDGVDLSKEYPADVVMGTQPQFFGDSNSFSTHAKVTVGNHLTFGWQQSMFVAPTSEGVLPSSVSFAARPENRTMLLGAYARFARDFGARTKGSVQVAYSRYEQRPDSKFNNSASGFADAFKYSLGERYQLEFRSSTTVSGRHRVTAGAVVDSVHAIPHTADLPARYDTSKAFSQQGYFYAGTGGTIPIQIFETHDVNAGAFGQLQTDWTERISTTIGLRADRNYGRSALSPRLGLVFRQSGRTVWKVLYGHAFLSPSPFLRYENFGALVPPSAPGGLYTGGFFRVPNETLAPERLRTAEASLNHQIGKGLSAGVAVYYTRVKDLTLAAPAPAPNLTFIPGASIAAPTSNQNIGTAKATGVDLTAEYAWVSSRARLNVWSGVTLIDGNLRDQVLNREYDLPWTSQQMFRGGVTWNLLDRLIVTASLASNGSQASFVTSASSVNFQKRVPGYTVGNLYAEIWTPGHHVAASLRITNLTDAHYYNAGNGTSTTFFRAPQDTRSIQGGLRVRF